jgi:serine/threonine protein kinase
MHANRIVHRDIKPENILLCRIVDKVTLFKVRLLELCLRSFAARVTFDLIFREVLLGFRNTPILASLNCSRFKR